MTGMFADATSFNQNIGGWNVSNVTDMSYMFTNARAFNTDISSWDVRNVNEMSYMFQNATSFNQDIRYWPLKSQTTLPYQSQMFYNSTLILQNFGFTATPAKAQFATPNIAPTVDFHPDRSRFFHREVSHL
jgi:surface protein